MTEAKIYEGPPFMPSPMRPRDVGHGRVFQRGDRRVEKDCGWPEVRCVKCGRDYQDLLAISERMEAWELEVDQARERAERKLDWLLTVMDDDNALTMADMDRNAERKRLLGIARETGRTGRRALDLAMLMDAAHEKEDPA